MRELHVNRIVETVRSLSISANTQPGDDLINALKNARVMEVSPTGKDILDRLLENAEIAGKENIPMCQDTGMAVVFVEMGQDVHLVGGSLKEAVDEGVRRGYADGFLRKSVCHPLTRKNTGDNTPAVLHLELSGGDGFKITVAPKGFGAENMSRVTMLPPSAGIEGVKEFIVQRVKAAGPNPCPPTVVGVGIGGTFEEVALMAKKALLRPLGSENRDPEANKLEKELLIEINRLGIGPQGFGGHVTSLAVHINFMPTHIASYPVAVNLQCHASRHKSAEL
jgi:fumarate hydratase subunit alpha